MAEITKNKFYWDSFYSEHKISIPTHNSDFSIFTLKKIEDLFPKRYPQISLLDMGCGNGRDTHFFRSNGVEASGIDLSYSNENCQYIKKKDVFSTTQPYDVYYLRFFLHTIEESKTDILIHNICKTMPRTSYVFLETRSSKEVTNEDKSETYFQSSVGEKHYRMLYSHKYLSSKIEEKMNLLFSEEARGLATHLDDDPYIIRMIATRK